MDTKECEWADLELYINGVKVTKVQGAKYKPTQEKEFLHAGGNDPISIQRGNKGCTGTINLLKGAVDALNAAARTAGGNNLLDISCTVVVNYKAKGSRTIQTDTMGGLEFSEYEKGMEQNAKSMPISLPFMALTLTEA